MPLLASALAREPVGGVIHPDEHDPRLWDVYLATDDGTPLFATVLMTPSRLDELLADGVVVEGFSLQVLPTDEPSETVIRAAMEQWATRNFQRAPTFTLVHWQSAEDGPEAGWLAAHDERAAPYLPVVTFEVLPGEVHPEVVVEHALAEAA